jgi:predicted ATP-grasp superfamily ATP-dependent carboligase
VAVEQIENRYHAHEGFPLIKIFVFEYLTGGGIDPDLAPAGSLADLSALIAEGRTMRDALAADLRALDGVETCVASSRFENIESAGPAFAYCRAKTGEPMLDFVARVSREHDYAFIVAPECDGLLLQLAAVVGAPRWLGCDEAAIRTASSKRTTAAHLAAHGIDVTPALTPAQLDGRGARRWVVKPDDGAGGLETSLYDYAADASADFEARAAAGRDPVLQEWVDGEPLSLSLVCGARGPRLVSINRQRIGLSSVDGPGWLVEFGGVDVDRIDRNGVQGRVLDALARRVCDVLPGLRGFCGIDVVWHAERGPVVIEVNPRLTVAYGGLSARLGRNLAADLLAAHDVDITACGAVS